MIDSLNESLNQERLNSSNISKERDTYIVKFNELLAQVKEQTTPEVFEKINASLTSNEVSADLSKKHAEEVNELKLECDRLKMENETLNGEVEKLIKESDMMMQM
jgi:uncharacterized coiled-coil DUF342 family protein